MADLISSAVTDAQSAISNAGATVSSAVSSATTTLSSTGLASSLTSITDGISGVIGGVTSFVSSFLKTPSGVKLPLPNPLFAYASYDYIFSIYALTDAELHNPDTTYMVKPPANLVLSSAHINPNNRPKTAFGSFEFYIDDVEMVTQIGMDQSASTNVFSINFKVTEPYSMGTFLLALQQAAQNAKQSNYLQAPYLLAIDFRGTTETGVMSTPPKTSRRIPFKFRNTSVTVTESGSVYSCDCYPWNIGAEDVQHSQIPKDVAVKGKTVQEILQTGEKSLQSIINQAKANEKTNSKKVAVPDQILILFPTDPSSAGTSGTATDSATTAVTTTDLAKKLGVTQIIPPNSKNSVLVQDAASVNELGKASLGLSDSRKGDAAFPQDNKAASQDPSKGVIRANNFIDPTTGDFRFSQKTDIKTAINEVLLNSDYVKKALTAGVVDDKGQRQWWRIDVQHYNISTAANDKYTGVKPKLTVYRVIPYTVHTSSGPMPPNTKAPGMANLGKECVKVYNYIYTGKNVDIIKFNMEFKMSFLTTLGQAGLDSAQDVKTVVDEGGAETQTTAPKVGGIGLGNAPQTNTQPTGVKNVKVLNSSDNKGGGGREDQATRSARLFHDAISMQSEMTNIEMEIIGDPYYIVQSGTGNYTSKQTEHQNLNADGGMNYQNGEVHIMINFRTPVDLNQATGLYNFGTASTSSNLMWSGLYKVISVTNKFKGGEFRQVIKAVRLPMSEAKVETTAEGTFNIQQPQPEAAPVTKTSPPKQGTKPKPAPAPAAATAPQAVQFTGQASNLSTSSGMDFSPISGFGA